MNRSEQRPTDELARADMADDVHFAPQGFKSTAGMHVPGGSLVIGNAVPFDRVDFDRAWVLDEYSDKGAYPTLEDEERGERYVALPGEVVGRPSHLVVFARDFVANFRRLID